jgi:site-specific recombinase XerD
MGTINTHRSKSGVITYRARIQRRGRKTLSATFPTLKDARRWLTLREADIIVGRHFPEQKARHTVNELFDHYQRDVMPLKGPETQRSQGYTIQYWRETFGHRCIDEIQLHEIKTHLTALTRQGKAPATITKYHTTLSHAYQMALVDYQWIETNPCRLVRTPALPPARIRYLSDEERTRLLQECRRSKNRFLYPLCVVALHTGLRRGSLLEVTVKGTSTINGTITLARTKNGRSLTLPLVGEALTIARELVKTSKDGYLFPRGSGYPWPYYRRAWEKALQRAKLTDCSFHTLRHSCASYLVQAGVDIYTVSRILTHTKVTTTQTYAHLAVDNLRDALEVLSHRLAQ